MNDKQVADLFVEQRVLQRSQAEDVLNEVDLNGKSIAQAMIDGGYVDQAGFLSKPSPTRSGQSMSISVKRKLLRRFCI